MKLRTTFLTVLTFLALVIGATVQAQDGFDPCFGLAADDCAAINSASANGIGDAESFTMDFSIDFAADGLESIFGLAASFDPSLAEDAISALTFTFDSTFDFAMDDDSELGLYMAGDMTISFSQDGGDVEELDVAVMLVDDVLYFDAGDGWSSIDLLRLLEDEDLGGQLDGLMGDFTNEDGEIATDDLPIDPSALGTLFGVLDLPGFLSYERSGNDFIFDIDFGALQALLEEDNEDLLNEIIISASEIDPSFAFFVPLVPTLISDGTVTITQTIDPDANIITDIVFDSNLELALGMLDGSGSVTSTELSVDIGLGNLDGVEIGEAPEDAVDVTDLVIGMVESGLGQGEDE